MAWPSFGGGKEGEKPVNAEVGEGDHRQVEAGGKSPADLIAESLSGFEARITERFTALDGRMNTVEQQTAKPVARVENPETPSVFENEDGAFASRVGPIAARQLELEARMVKAEVKAEYVAAGFGEMWSKFEHDITGQLDASALVQPDGGGGVKALRGDPGYVRNVVDMILGRALRAKGIKFDGGKDRFFLEDAGGSGNAGPSAEALAAEGFTNDQLRVIRRMGIPLEDAKKSKAKLTFVN
jgi:hypothetical protein